MRLLPLTLLLMTAPLCAQAAPTTPPPAPVAAPPPGPPPVPPKVFREAGYSQPDVPVSACKAIDASRAECAVPAMTAGAYVAVAAGVSTATAADAAQQITIVAGDQSCTSTHNPDAKTAWAVGAKRTFYASCLFTIVTDTPLTVTAAYFDAKATKEPTGPVLRIYRRPWSGVLTALPVPVSQ
jgi:hypothetical protein